MKTPGAGTGEEIWLATPFLTDGSPELLKLPTVFVGFTIRLDKLPFLGCGIFHLVALSHVFCDGSIYSSSGSSGD